MKHIFTICSNNYLAQAKVLMDSASKLVDYELTIFIVDKKDEGIDYSFFCPCRILFIEDLFSEQQLTELAGKYNIIELNTAVKASCFKYIFEKFPESEFAFYLDPDIKIFSSFCDIEAEFEQFNFLLTPHILNANVRELQGKELAFLKSGIYNLGFLGLKNNSADVDKFLEWWEYRLMNYCFISSHKGLFVDQKWADYLPCLFEKVKIIRNPGCNMAPWNIMERRLTDYSGDNLIVNDKFNLYFFHFSNYNPKKPEVISKFYDFVTTDDRKDLKQLYESYYRELIENKYEMFSACSNGLDLQPLKYPLYKKIVVKSMMKSLQIIQKNRY